LAIGNVTGATTFTIAPDGSGSSAGASCTGASCSATAPGLYKITGSDGAATGSTTVTVTSGTLPPTTAVLLPSKGATLSGSTTLDASASNATSVEFRLFGGSYGYNAPVLCTATLTYYGWVCSWNTTTVPNGSYSLSSEAFGAGGSAFSSGVSITVKN
jgi:hypothetical protein